MSKKIEDTCLRIKALDELDKTDYIHYNLPQNELETYEKTIEWVKSLNIDSKMLEPSEIPLYNLIDILLTKVNAILDYYREIAKIYQKTSFVIKDYSALQFLEINISCIDEMYIDDRVKEKLNEAIDLLVEKRKEIIDYKIQNRN